MELDVFISQTLISITTGVVTAQKEIKTIGGLVNPTGLMRSPEKAAQNAIWDNSNNNYAQIVTFDIAVTAEDKIGGGGQIKVMGIGVGIGADTKNVTASRIQFNIPILLPEQNINKPEARGSSKVSVSVV